MTYLYVFIALTVLSVIVPIVSALVEGKWAKWLSLSSEVVWRGSLAWLLYWFITSTISIVEFIFMRLMTRGI